MTKSLVINNSAEDGTRKSRKSQLMTSAAAAVLVAFGAPSAVAQVTVTDAGGADTLGTVTPQGQVEITESDQVLVDLAAGLTSTVTVFDNDDSSNIRVDGNAPANMVIITNAGTIDNDVGSDDEEVAIFVDNGEDGVTINNSGLIQGDDGVIFLEGDGATLVNSGTIEGTGAQTEGVIFIDRDADSLVNTITNQASGVVTSVGGPTISVESLLGTVGGGDPEGATPAEPSTFTGVSDVVISNAGQILNTGTDSSDSAITLLADFGNTSEGSLDFDDPNLVLPVGFALNAVVDSDSDASPRGCLENIAGVAEQQVNCVVNLTLTNTNVIDADGGSGLSLIHI